VDEPDDTLPLADADLQDLAAQMRTEWHADYEELAGEARMQWEHNRTLMDRVHDAMARGDRLGVAVGDAQFVGTITNLGTDWCTVSTSSGPVDVRLAMHMGQIGTPVLVHQLERGRSGGMRAPQPQIGFRARCYELEMLGGDVQVGIANNGEAIMGALIVGADHLMVTSDDRPTFVPLDWVAWVARRTPDR